MKTFTFKAVREYVSYKECSYSIEANNKSEAEETFFNAIDNNSIEEYCNHDYHYQDHRDILNSTVFFDEDEEPIHIINPL